MDQQEPNRLTLFTSEELAIHVVDTLVDHGLVDKVRFKDAVASVKWELDAQRGIGRVRLHDEEMAR